MYLLPRTGKRKKEGEKKERKETGLHNQAKCSLCDLRKQEMKELISCAKLSPLRIYKKQDRRGKRHKWQDCRVFSVGVDNSGGSLPQTTMGMAPPGVEQDITGTVPQGSP